jgi:hypothetical protein
MKTQIMGAESGVCWRKHEGSTWLTLLASGLKYPFRDSCTPKGLEGFLAHVSPYSFLEIVSIWKLTHLFPNRWSSAQCWYIFKTGKLRHREVKLKVLFSQEWDNDLQGTDVLTHTVQNHFCLTSGPAHPPSPSFTAHPCSLFFQFWDAASLSSCMTFVMFFPLPGTFFSIPTLYWFLYFLLISL